MVSVDVKNNVYLLSSRERWEGETPTTQADFISSVAARVVSLEVGIACLTEYIAGSGVVIGITESLVLVAESETTSSKQAESANRLVTETDDQRKSKPLSCTKQRSETLK